MSNLHPKGEKLAYFICHGDPQFDIPTKQINDNNKCNFVSLGLRYFDRVDSLPKSKLL